MSIEAMKQALADAKRNERHLTVAETRYWCKQYKMLAERFIATTEESSAVQEPVVITTGMALAFHRVLSDGPISKDEAEEIKRGLESAFAHMTTHPQPKAEPKREPLTDASAIEVVKGVVSTSDRPIGVVLLGLFILRATEAAHGIKGEA